MDYAVLGDSVILAQRLESAAPSGETYVSELTYRLTARQVRVRARRRADAQGEGEPVPAWRLLGERAAAPADALQRALVGRERELAAIAAALRSAEPGSAVVVTVTGEPGVGKSRLTRGAPAARRARGSVAADAMPLLRRRARVLAVRDARPHVRGDRARGRRRTPRPTRSAPYRRRVRGRRTSHGCWGCRRHDEVVARSSPRRFRRGLHDAFASWLAELAAERPRVLALEDVHWADASCLELTGSSRGCARAQPLALYLIARPEAERGLSIELATAIAARSPLEPLDETGSRSSFGPARRDAAKRARRPGSSTARPAIRSSSRSSCAPSRRTADLSPERSWEMRPRLGARTRCRRRSRGLLASRIDLLPRPAAVLLQTASVIGRERAGRAAGARSPDAAEARRAARSASSRAASSTAATEDDDADGLPPRARAGRRLLAPPAPTAARSPSPGGGRRRGDVRRRRRRHRPARPPPLPRRGRRKGDRVPRARGRAREAAVRERRSDRPLRSRRRARRARSRTSPSASWRSCSSSPTCTSSSDDYDEARPPVRGGARRHPPTFAPGAG